MRWSFAPRLEGQSRRRRHKMVEQAPTSSSDRVRDAPSSSQAAPSFDAGMSAVVHQNIRSLKLLRQEEESRRGFSDRLADAVTAFAGSMRCVYVHTFGF